MTLAEYHDNAYDPKELGVTISYNDFAIKGVQYKEDYLLTFMRGKCLYYEMKEKVDLKCSTQLMVSIWTKTLSL